MEACVWSGQGTLGPPLGLTCLAEVVSLPGQRVPCGSLHSRAHLVGDVPSKAREERGVAGSGYLFILEDCFHACNPGGSDSKPSVCSEGDLGLTPGSGRSPGEGSSYPLQYSCPENPMVGEAWWATVHRLQRVRHD